MAADDYPLTALQESMVHASLRAPGSGVYILQDVCELSDPPDAALLERAWRQVARRHLALRTGIATGAGERFRQCVQEEPAVAWQELDWTGMPPEEKPAALAAFLDADSARGFPLDGGIPARFALIRNPAGAATLIWTIHHALVDGRSLLIAWREWFAIYDALTRAEEAALAPPVPLREHLARHDFAIAENYWRAYMRGLAATTGFVQDRLRPAQPRERPGFAGITVRMPEALTGELRSFARSNGLTMSTLLHGAWALLLSRYSGRTDVVFGVTRSRRQGAEDTVGLLINTLPLRVGVPPEGALLPWLNQIREQWIAQREYEHAPLDKVWEWSGLPRGTPPFDTLLVYDHEPPGETLRRLGGGWRGRALHRVQRMDAPLALAAYGAPLLTLQISYDARLFSGHTVAALAAHLETLLRGFPSAPARLADLRMLPESEERWLVEDLNRTEVPFPGVCVHRLFEEQARRMPEHPALEDARRSISYRQANQQANRLARVLRQKGAAAEDVVAVCMTPSPETVIAILAVLKAGAAFLSLDPGLPAPRLARMVENAGARLVLSDLDALWEEASRHSAEDLPDTAAPFNAAYVIYTSGSTGEPKGVAITHQALVNHTLATTRVYGIAEADRRLQFAPAGTDPFVSGVFNSLCLGATLVFGPARAATSVEDFLRLLDARRITITGIPATWWHEWVATIPEDGYRPPPSLRALIVGMERADPAALVKWKRAAGAGIRLFNAYGPTETCPTTTIYEAGASEWEGAAYVPIGKPIANTHVYLRDDHGNPVPAGVPGELYIGGAGVARGYLGAPDLTARRFLPDPHDPARRLYRTGDLAFYLPDGNLVLLGRADRQVKIRGFRVELDEIEAVLSRHPGVRQCAVVLQDRLAAYVTPLGSPPAAEELRAHLSRHLPAHMVPAACMVLAEMPLTPGGKIDRQSLPPCRPDVPAGFQAPSTPTERRLAALWREVLGVERAGVADSFFDLGGDSLRASRLIRLIDREFGKALPLAALFQAPTIARLASLLADQAAPPRAVVVLQERGVRLPFFCLTSAADNPYRFLPLAKHLGHDQPFYVLADAAGDGGPMQRVEQLAARACRLIRDIRPRGPYLLSGYCFGGTVAFEAARQLVSAGEEVRLVALFDAAAPGPPKLRRGRARNFLALLRERAGRVGLPEIVAHLQLAGRMLKRRMLAPYAPQPMAFPVLQFLARDDALSGRIFEDPRLGWRSLCQGSFRAYPVNASHHTLFQEPQAREMAAALEPFTTA